MGINKLFVYLYQLILTQKQFNEELKLAWVDGWNWNEHMPNDCGKIKYADERTKEILEEKK